MPVGNEKRLPEGCFDPGTSQAKSNRDEVDQALRGLRFGQVTVIVQDGRIVQIDRTEKRRLV